MSEIKITIENDNKDEQKSDLPKQTSLDTSVYMHATQDEEKDVRRTVLHKEEEHETRGEEIDVKIKSSRTSNDAIFGNDKEYVVCYDFSRQAPPPQGPGGYPNYPPPYGAQYGPPPQAPQYGGYFGQENQPPPPPQYGGFFGAQNQNQGHPVYMSGPPLYYDPEGEDRNAFVRKVTIITLLMLIITAAFVAVVLFIPGVKEVYIKYRLIFYIISMVGMIAMSCIMPTAACARQFPTNMLSLLLAVVLQCQFLGVVSATYETHILLQALIATLVVVGLCVILACTSFDFTKLILYVIAIGVAFSVLSMIMMVSMLVFHVYSKPLYIALVFGLTLLSVVTLIMDLQMILGGRSIELSEDDYALGAYMLYTSIVDIFIKLVILMQAAD